MKIQLTADGSSTIYIPELDEHYHSVNGAVQESRHVFLNAGFNLCTKGKIQVLELGFGTGLNALLTAIEAEKRKIQVHYITLEKYPLTENVLNQLNYSELDENLCEKIHRAEWEKEVSISPFFSIQKIQTDFSDYTFPDLYDVVYYDAFAPDKQAEVWTQDLFDRIARQMNSEAILTTYCAKGAIRRMMQAAGLSVERIPGPPGKREMLRARKLC
jgi:Uncharacterized conserved protein